MHIIYINLLLLLHVYLCHITYTPHRQAKKKKTSSIQLKWSGKIVFLLVIFIHWLLITAERREPRRAVIIIIVWNIMIAFGFARNLLIISTATLASNLSAATRKKLSTILESWENAKTIFNAGYLFGGSQRMMPRLTNSGQASQKWMADDFNFCFSAVEIGQQRAVGAQLSSIITEESVALLCVLNQQRCTHVWLSRCEREDALMDTLHGRHDLIKHLRIVN